MGEAFIIRRGGGSGGTGATLVVSAPSGVTATATKDGKTYTRVVNADGTTTFKGLSSGTWALSISDASHEPTTPVDVIIAADYAVTLAFFAATINVTYPEGSTCTATHEDGTELTAPDTSGTWTFIVPSSGTWTLLSTANDGSGKSNSVEVEITSEGQSTSVTISYEQYLYSSNPSNQYSDITGGWKGIIKDNYGSLTFTDNYMNLYVYAGYSEIAGWQGTVYTVNPIVIIGDTLEFVVSTSWNIIGISSETGKSEPTYLAKKTNPASGTHTVDVSSFVGQSVYVCATKAVGSNGGSGNFRIVSVRNY